MHVGMEVKSTLNPGRTGTIVDNIDSTTAGYDLTNQWVVPVRWHDGEERFVLPAELEQLAPAGE